MNPLNNSPEAVQTAARATALMQMINESLQIQLAGAGLRLNLFARYVRVAQVHQDSIMVLIGMDRAVSAFALGRPLIETGVRGLWLNYKATDEQLVSFGKNQFEFKPMKLMLDDLEDMHKAGGLFSTHKDFWKTLCGLTHSGMELIGRMSSPTGDIDAHFTPLELIALMEYALATWMLVVIGFLSTLKKESELENILDLYHHLFPESMKLKRK